MTSVFLSSLFDVFRAPFLVWDPASNLVQTAVLCLVVLGLCLTVRRLIF